MDGEMLHTPGAFTPRTQYDASIMPRTILSSNSPPQPVVNQPPTSLLFWRIIIVAIIILTICIATSIALAENTSAPLTLKEAERLGVSNHDLFANTINNQTGATEKDSEETKITFGIEKPPATATNVTTYIHDQTNVYKVGVQQVFSNNDAYNSQTQKISARHAAQLAQHNEKNQQTLADIRETWLELYYWTQTIQVIQKKIDELQKLLPSVSNSTPILETAIIGLADQQQQAKQKISTLQTKLGNLIGTSSAQRPLPEKLPAWPAPPAIETLRANMKEHPKLQADDAQIAAIRAEIALDKSDSDSSFALGASYGIRQDDVTSTSPHSDMISASISMKMPAPPEKGIDRSSKANIKRLETAQTQQETDYRNLIKTLNMQYAIWKKKTEEFNTLAQQAATTQQTTDSALQAYQNHSIDLNALLGAYKSQLEVELAKLRAEVDVAEARAELLYFE